MWIMIENAEDMAFLESQDQGRKGYMAGEDEV
jgi:hypothetical protein